MLDLGHVRRVRGPASNSQLPLLFEVLNSRCAVVVLEDAFGWSIALSLDERYQMPLQEIGVSVRRHIGIQKHQLRFSIEGFTGPCVQ